MIVIEFETYACYIDAVDEETDQAESDDRTDEELPEDFDLSNIEHR